MHSPKREIRKRQPGDETWLTYKCACWSTCITFTATTYYVKTEILDSRGGRRRLGGCLPSRLCNKLRQAFSEVNLWLSGQHGLLPMTICFCISRSQRSGEGRGSACISPMRWGRALSPSPLVGFSLLWVWGCEWEGSSPLHNKTQTCSKAVSGHSWLAVVVLPEQLSGSVKSGDEKTV